MYGMTLGGFVPLSALMPLLVPKNRAAALSVLSLGAGASTWVGPAIVAIFSASLGVAGIIWIFAGLYALSAFLMIPLRDPEELRDPKAPTQKPASAPGATPAAAH